MSNKAYCGYSATAPKGQKMGTLDECFKAHQLRRYGRMAVKDSELPMTRKASKPKPKTTRIKTTKTQKNKLWVLNQAIEHKPTLVFKRFYEVGDYPKRLKKVIAKIESKKTPLTKEEDVTLKRARILLQKVEQGAMKLFTDAEAEAAAERFNNSIV